MSGFNLMHEDNEAILFIILDSEGFIVDSHVKYISDIPDSVKLLISEQEVTNPNHIVISLGYDDYIAVTYIAYGDKDDVDYPCILTKKVLVTFKDSNEELEEEDTI